MDILFGITLGGGTDINKSVEYCSQLIEAHSKTIMFLISDLCEGGNRAALLRRLEELKQSGVTVISLLAISDGGKPYYDERTAQKVATLGIPCFACAPERLTELLQYAFSGSIPDNFTKKTSDFTKNKCDINKNKQNVIIMVKV